ncbi:histidine kinase [Yinghuangia sp. ASG 101]|uniref:sensor histidine kinase n=1 Tax=Yinghuangia sp. ASG 101 TaxID=2896848 RepID=UPI001E31DB81|nr:histidine kinase [Yinghuangia sp. ASG 101]UGQ08963.1 histidine kinase [Yinghuangia sp. ASG 101]
MTAKPTHAGGASSYDALLALLLAAGGLVLGYAAPGTRPLDPLGAVLLVGACAALPWRRVRPGLVLIVVLVVTVPYHALDYRHEAASPVALVALATYSSRVARVKALIIGVTIMVTGISIMSFARDGGVSGDHLGAIGWIFFSAVAGQAWRNHKAYIASIIDRAERAERAREVEVRRRVAEERVRIARDLHDLLAHSITLIGVQAGVAAHLARQPEPDGTVLARALEAIADTCRDARTDVRAALTALREDDEAPDHGAVPGLAGVWDLAASVRNTGVEVVVAVDAGADDLAPAVGVAAYRIVQEALTNVVRHADAGRVRVTALRGQHDLVLTIADDGRGTAPPPGPGTPAAQAKRPDGTAPAPGGPPDGPGGFGIIGMTERARSVGGTLTAAPGEDSGFVVRAVLPTGPHPNGGPAPEPSARPGAVPAPPPPADDPRRRTPATPSPAPEAP